MAAADYLNYTFSDSPEFVHTFDEQPLWSASFGLLLLRHLELKPNMTVLDLGSGAGFPLLELAERLGTSCKCYGIDPWVNANIRARQKIKDYEISNVEIMDCSAAELPFADASVDLIISNLGINNFDDPGKVFKECSRVLRQNGKLALTTNVNGHWREFYYIYEETLIQLNHHELVIKLKEQQEHRGSVNSISSLFTDSGLNVCRHFEDSFEMKFLNGTAFLNHHFIKLGWMASLRDVVPEPDRIAVFTQLEANLNTHAAKAGELKLTVPMVYMEGVKIF